MSPSTASSPSWMSTLELALALLRQHNYDEALKAFDKVFRAHGYEAHIFTLRISVLVRLKELQMVIDEPDISKTMLANRLMSFEDEQRELKGESDEEAIRLFQLLARLPPYLRHSIMAIHPETDDIFPSSSIDKAEALLAKERARDGRNFIETLPSELLSKIGRHYLDCLEGGDEFRVGRERELGPFVLAGISRRWRTVVREDASLVGTFDLGEDDGEDKVRAMLGLGPLREIWIGSESGGGLPEQVGWLTGHVGSLKKLSIPLDETTTFEGFWNLWTSKVFSLTHLQLIHDDPHGKDDSDDGNSQGGNTDDETQQRLIQLPPPDLDISSITHLALSQGTFSSDTSLLPLLHRMPNLQSLTLSSCSVNLFLPDASTPSDPTVVHLPNLLTLSLTESHLQNSDLTIFSLPNLQELHLSARTLPYSYFLFPPSPSSPNHTHLRVLDIKDQYEIEIDEARFIEHLDQLEDLRELSLSEFGITDATLRRLEWPEEGGGCCPRLDRIGFQHLSYEISKAAMVRMAKSRRNGSIQAGGCARIERLRIGGDSRYLGEDGEALLREQVRELIV